MTTLNLAETLLDAMTARKADLTANQLYEIASVLSRTGKHEFTVVISACVSHAMSENPDMVPFLRLFANAAYQANIQPDAK